MLRHLLSHPQTEKRNKLFKRGLIFWWQAKHAKNGRHCVHRLVVCLADSSNLSPIAFRPKKYFQLNIARTRKSFFNAKNERKKWKRQIHLFFKKQKLNWVFQVAICALEKLGRDLESKLGCIILQKSVDCETKKKHLWGFNFVRLASSDQEKPFLFYVRDFIIHQLKSTYWWSRNKRLNLKYRTEIQQHIVRSNRVGWWQIKLTNEIPKHAKIIALK